MNTIRLCFTATVAFLVVGIGGRVASCEDHTVDIVPGWKCCPWDKLYDPEIRFCRLAGTDVEEYQQRFLKRLLRGFRVAANTLLKISYDGPLYCNDTEELVDVPAVEIRGLIEALPSPIELPPDYCFDLTPSDKLVAQTCRPRNQYCGRVTSCKDIVPGLKCCPVDRLYDPEMRFCRPDGMDGEQHEQRLMDRLDRKFLVAGNAELKMFYDGPIYCDLTEVLVDVPDVEVRGLMEANTSPIEWPPNYCFDLTPSDKLVAQTCRPRDQYCGRANYTCFHKCCGAGRMYVGNPNNKDMTMCENREMPFSLSAYETDTSGSPVGRSNNTVVPFYGILSCHTNRMKDNMFMLTTDGNLHLTTEFDEWIIPGTEYCLEYYAEDGPPEAGHLIALVCTNAKPPSYSFAFWVILTASVVCLVLTLIVYATLPYLRNAHSYYVMFYMACQLLYFVCVMIRLTVKHDLDSPLCIPFGYFRLFSTLTTCCWLNVICFDIYWTLRYNNLINRNTSKSVRTIMYHIYCWGFSSICVSTGYLFQHSQNETLRELAPDIGKYYCDFYNYYHYGIFIFYYLPSCGTLTANLILFLLTAIHCSKTKSELNKFKRTDSKTEMFLSYKERFVMSIKLFMVFGIPFLLMMLCKSFLIKGIIRMIIERIYFLQGVYIFIIFVAKRKVIMEIRKKFGLSTVQSELIQLNTITGSS